MEIFYLDKILKLPMLEISCATIGNFDGVHIGHQNLINKTKVPSFKSLVITFDYVNKDNHCLLTLDDKINKIKELEIDYLIVLKYEDFKDMFYYEFIKILKKIKVKKIIIGKDFRFGFKQEGDYIDLQNKFELDILDDILINNKRISTTTIKQYLKDGLIIDANNLLGYNYFLTGIVEKGNQIGITIGFPTANLSNNNVLKPGVYKTKTLVGDVCYNSITNIGVNPTINKLTEMKVETHIFNFDKDIYSQEIKVIFYDYIREEKKFNNKEELISQLEIDKQSWNN